jgi:hypothetical protein
LSAVTDNACALDTIFILEDVDVDISFRFQRNPKPHLVVVMMATVTVMVQGCCRGVTWLTGMLPMVRYSPDFGAFFWNVPDPMMCYKGVTIVLQMCYNVDMNSRQQAADSRQQAADS